MKTKEITQKIILTALMAVFSLTTALAADVRLILDAPDGDVQSGVPFNLSLSLINDGPGTATGIEATLPLAGTLPGGFVTVQSAASGRGSILIDTNVLTWRLEELEPDVLITMDIQVDVALDDGEETSLFGLEPLVDLFEEDPDLTNNATTENVRVVIPRDFGDAPDRPYSTLFDRNGARHRLVDGWHLGQLIDHERDGQPSLGADGDDLAGRAIDDEDGVTFSAPLVGGSQSVWVQVVASTNGFLDAWIDFDADGSWETNEQVFASQPLQRGRNGLRFGVPEGSVVGQTYSRWRFSDTGGLSPRGFAGKGEVEDHMVDILGGPTVQTNDLELELTVPVDPQEGQVLVADVTNHGADEAVAVELSLDLEDGIAGSARVLQVQASQGTCWITQQGLECDLGNLASQASASVTLVIGSQGGNVFATAAVGSSNPDQDLSNNSAMVSLGSTTAPALDFGDAPDNPYPTLLDGNGARHRIVAGWYLGSSVDAESDGQPNRAATGDDYDRSATPDDEDGVVFGYPLVKGVQSTVLVVASTNGVVDGWIDYNRDGTWAPAEKFLDGQPVGPGPNFLSFIVPPGTPRGDTFTRIRFSRNGLIHPHGPAPIGEVEDYRIRIGTEPEERVLQYFWYQGALILHWDLDEAILQEADEVTGPWTSRPEITSPYQVPFGSPQKYFRLMRPGSIGTR